MRISALLHMRNPTTSASRQHGPGEVRCPQTHANLAQLQIISEKSAKHVFSTAKSLQIRAIANWHSRKLRYPENPTIHTIAYKRFASWWSSFSSTLALSRVHRLQIRPMHLFQHHRSMWIGGLTYVETRICTLRWQLLQVNFWLVLRVLIFEIYTQKW